MRPIRGLDYGAAFLLDEMHFALLGVCKKFMTAWTEHSGKTYFLTESQVG